MREIISISHIEELPVDTIVEVCLYLSNDDLRNLSVTSKDF